ncbi:MAG: pseudouridine synthase [Gammaproteobacteria bacterium]|nr:pseudouridine synthase [Gammaproteobacteria bacterium]
MSISKYPSKLSLPQTNPGISSVLEYLIVKFPNIKPEVWQQRVANGKVHWHDGSLIAADTPFQAQQRVYYYREVDIEPVIPFSEKILFQDEHILVAEKPHFLAVAPTGIYVEECLQTRLRKKTGLQNLQALHRLDRPTTGLVLFSVNPDNRHLYHNLFKSHQIHKTYHAIARVNSEENLLGQQWEIKNRIIKSEPRFLMKMVEGVPNSHSIIRCLQQSGDKALFELKPITGKTHQLRLHMQSLGWPLLNDVFYPALLPRAADNYSCPLQLLAKELRFIDPVTQQSRVFTSNTELRLE